MDHSENDKRFCVYVLRDTSGTVRYVGSGTEKRAHKKQRSNNKELLAIIKELEVEILKTGLSKDDSILEEIKLYQEYKPTGLLLNKLTPSGILPIDFDLVNKFLYYDETSPTFLRWKIDIPSGRYNRTIKTRSGDVAGSIKKTGYSETKLLGRLYKNHRVIWVLCNKQSLTTNLVIDHIDRNKSNNSIENLRLVTQKENMYNFLPKDVKSRTGLVGIYDSLQTPLIHSCWLEGFVKRSKTFNFRKIFPGVEEEVAKEKCIELAVWYQEQMISKSANLF